MNQSVVKKDHQIRFRFLAVPSECRGCTGRLRWEYPKAADQDVPWWWKESRRDLREREEKILEQREVYKLQTVDHGQVVKYEGDRPIETAKSGILRVGSHSKYGFGELRVKPVEPRPDQCKNSEKNGETTE